MPALNGMAFPGRKQDRKEPKDFHLGDIDVPWNISRTIYSTKAARNLTISDITIDVGEVLSPSGCPVFIEAWKNGKYGGEIELKNGPTEFKQKLELKRLDEVELRIVVKGTETPVDTKVNKLWLLYCVC